MHVYIYIYRCKSERRRARGRSVAARDARKQRVHAPTLPRSKRQVEARLKGFAHVPPKLRVHPRTLANLK